MKYFSNKKGFSLIELLVVIAIIAILTSIVTANLTQSKAKARDGKRVSDILQIQLTLEMIFDRCNAYPPNITNTNTIIKAGCKDPSGTDYTIGYFISKIPTPPTTIAGDVYDYTVSPSFNDYVLRSKLETNSSNVLSDDIDGSVLSVDCSDSASGYYYCVVPK